MLVPYEVFRALKFDELKSRRMKGEADGTSLDLQAVYGILEIPEIHFDDESSIESNPHVRETLVGIRGVKKLRMVIDGHRRTITIDKC
jgi:hypothetical protein